MNLCCQIYLQKLARQLIILFIFSILCISTFAQTFEKKNAHIFFDVNQDELTAESRKIIRQAIIEIGSVNIREIYIEGHTDNDASDEYNTQLSERRAENTKIFLKKQGVKERMINMEYFGESKPSSDVKSENRRVTVTFVYEMAETASISMSPKILVVNIFKAGTNEKLPCHYIVEAGGQNSYGKTDHSAKCIFKSLNNTSEITFSREGYLNESIVISEVTKEIRNDSAFINVYLKPVMVLQKLRFEHIFFYTDSDELKPESKPELTSLLKMLQQNPDLYVEIQGHMNFAVSRKATVAHKKYNLDLSHKRAKAVYNFLVSNGIPKNRLTYKGLSNFQMIYPDPQTRDQEDMNKRVEVWTLQIISDNSVSKP